MQVGTQSAEYGVTTNFAQGGEIINYKLILDKDSSLSCSNLLIGVGKVINSDCSDPTLPQTKLYQLSRSPLTLT